MRDELDAIDLQILEILQEDGRASHSAIGQAVGLSQPSVHERVKKLEQRGVITGYRAIVDPEALGLSVLAFISVRLDEYRGDTVTDAVQQMPQVLEAHHISGEDCLLFKVRCKTPKDVQAVLERIWKTCPVAASKTTIAFTSYKETTALPVAVARPERMERSA
jgi:Lrp/AsnC family leucine-responsive transcriptional regulator